MRNLKNIQDLEPITAEQFHKKLGKHDRFKFQFLADFDELMEMGYEGSHCSGCPITGANMKADDILEEYVPDLVGSMSDMSYNIVGYVKHGGVGMVIIEVYSSTKEFEFEEETA